jgi:drug/metabolite transporter (DMT)-like permease
LLVLLLVPLAWGTYGPAVKSLYALEAPPPELMFNWMNYIVASSSLAAVTAMRPALPLTPGADAADADADADAKADADADAKADADVSRAAVLAGLELGAYLFAGSTVQIFGMRYTSAGRAAFIVQLTTVIVPLLDAALNRRLPDRFVLAGCALAFAGVSVLLTDGSGGGGALDLASVDWSLGPAGLVSQLLSTSAGVGDALVGASALAYSLHVVRLSYHAPRLPPVVLARAKELSRLVYATVALGVGVMLAPGQADALGAFVRSFTEAPSAAALALSIVVWNGLVTTAFPTWAQSYGQAAVSAGTAQVMYTSQPLWSALFGFLVLGETFSQQGAAGALLMFSAVVVVALAESRREEEASLAAGSAGEQEGEA